MSVRALLIISLLLPAAVIGDQHEEPTCGPHLRSIASNSCEKSRLEKLLDSLDQIRQSAGVAGLALTLVNTEETIWSGGRGVANRDTEKPMTADTLIRIGSVTKAFTALSLLALDEAGKLSLDSNIATLMLAPPYTNPWASSHPVTLAQLLEHSAGLGDLSKIEWDHNEPLTLAAALQVDPDSRLLQWPPGLHSSYSNSGAGVAAQVMQRVTGLNFEDHTAKSVFEPLGMDSATFRLTDSVKTGLATGYDSDGQTIIPYWHTLYRPFGGINVTARQMGPFVRMLLARGRLDQQQIFSAALIDRMEHPETTLAARSGLEFGYGPGNYQWVHDGFVFHGHGGDADGYLSRFAYNRDAGLGYFLVINAFKGSTLRRLRDEIEDFIVYGLKPRFQAGVPQPSEQLRQLTGRYQTATRRFAGKADQHLEISYEQNRLYMRRNGRRQHLIPLSAWHFRRVFEPVATTAFIHGFDGRLYLQGPFGNYVRLDASTSSRQD